MRQPAPLSAEVTTFLKTCEVSNSHWAHVADYSPNPLPEKTILSSRGRPMDY